MYRQRIFILSGLGLSVWLTALADPLPEGYTLADALTVAQENNAGLQAAHARYEAAMQRVPQAAALPDPRLQVTHFVESVQTRTGPQENVITLSQSIPWFGMRDSRADAAHAHAQSLFYSYQARERSLVIDVAQAFFDYGFIGRAIDLTQRSKALLYQLLPVVEARVEGGEDLNNLLRLQVEIGRIEDHLRTLERQRVEVNAYLGVLLGLTEPVSLPWPDWDAPTETPLDTPMLFLALEEHPSLAISDQRIVQAIAQERVARLQRYPDFMLGINYIETGEAMDPSMRDSGVDPWGVTVGINIPLWWGKNRAVERETRLGRMAEERTRLDAEQRLRSELSVALERYDESMARLRLYGESLLPLARQALEITRTSYEGDRATILEVIDSERSLIELDQLYWRAAANAWQSRIVIQALSETNLLEIQP